MDKLIDLLQLAPENKVLDIGAGNCEIPIRLIEKYGVSATAIEMNEQDMIKAEQLAEERIPVNHFEFIKQDVNRVMTNYSHHYFDAGFCIGSTHAIGDLKMSMESLKKYVKKEGLLLLGDCYWKKTPDPGYLAALGAKESDYQSHDGNIQTGVEAGLTPVWAFTASDEEWDQFEWSGIMSIEHECREMPWSPDCASRLRDIRNWRQMYTKWGRETLGFGMYLFRNEERSEQVTTEHDK